VVENEEDGGAKVEAGVVVEDGVSREEKLLALSESRREIARARLEGQMEVSKEKERWKAHQETVKAVTTPLKDEQERLKVESSMLMEYLQARHARLESEKARG